MKRVVAGMAVALSLVVASNVLPISEVHASTVTSSKKEAVPTLTGKNVNPRWLSEYRLLVTNENESLTDYVVYINSKEHLLYLPRVANIVVSPNGQFAAYTNENSEIFLVESFTKRVTKLSSDQTYKTELQWLNNESLVFLSGDKSDKVVKISVVNGMTTDLLADKVEFKQDLKVSADGQKLLYAVAKEGKVNLDDNKEVANVDTSSSIPQLYYFDSSIKGTKPVQLTNSSDNKIFANFLADGRIVYISADIEDDNSLSILKVVQPDGKGLKEVITSLNVEKAEVTADGRLFVLASSDAGRGIYEVNPYGPTSDWTKLIVEADDVSDFHVSARGDIAVTIDTEAGSKVALLSNGTFVDLTK